MPASEFPKNFAVTSEDTGKRLDQFLASHLTETSRARVQQLIAEQQVKVNEAAAKASARLRAGDQVSVLGEVQPPPLRAIAEEIPLDIVYEDADLAVVNKPSGMMVHAGAGATEAERNRGTLVNALLHRFGELSDVGGELRPGIVHRLDKATSGLIIVAKNDEAHRRLSAAFAARKVKKTYIALVHGWMEKEKGTVSSSISRDPVRRTRMTTRGPGREAITHYKVLRRIESRFGKFTLLEVQIDTGRTHQIRVHLSSLKHPVVGDALYGAPREIHELQGRGQQQSNISLARNFLHAAALRFEHPRSGEAVSLAAPLPAELEDFLAKLAGD
ncbi:MAG: RluA family pseudouridine synthase [Acidobacteriaceae bacterium]